MIPQCATGNTSYAARSGVGGLLGMLQTVGTELVATIDGVSMTPTIAPQAAARTAMCGMTPAMTRGNLQIAAMAVPPARPAMIRLRRGKFRACGTVPTGDSEISRWVSAMRR